MKKKNTSYTHECAFVCVLINTERERKQIWQNINNWESMVKGIQEFFIPTTSVLTAFSELEIISNDKF